MRKLRLKLRYKLFEPLASVLPEWLLRRLGGWRLTYRLCLDPTDGWNFWLGASYLKYCRKDQRRQEGENESD